MSTEFILAVDQGTSGTKAVVFDAAGKVVAKATEPLTSYFPHPGFVEQDPVEIYQNVLAATKACLEKFQDVTSADLGAIATCGISNQRETLVLWDESGRPLGNAIVWQCKRSVEICNRLQRTELEQQVRRRTGLVVDPYFSGTKLLWLCENDRQVAEAIRAGRACFGTVDTWLLYNLTGRRRYLTDYTNASRTLLFNIDELDWDAHLLAEYGLTALRLPEARPSSSDYGVTDFEGLLPRAIPISALIGDSHAAAFGERCFSPGAAKATLGTGCSILLNTGAKPVPSEAGMVTTICWSTADRVDYALEGIIVTCGATINWLRDNMGLFVDGRETGKMALAVKDNAGVYLVPAFSGLGAPHWKMDLRAAILGLTFGCDKNHVVRAALESIPYQIKDVVDAMDTDSGVTLQQLKVDGGLTTNHFVMQFLADLLGTEVVNVGIPDVSALGAACLAGLQRGIFGDLDRLEQLNVDQQTYCPGAGMPTAQRDYEGWKRIVQQLTAPPSR
ncbi:MAG: glycerol kinase GlpK [Phycisphaerales bacterium]|nr:MAG: glycerol kinase GlpK [Phycisphaerales bacterium]